MVIKKILNKLWEPTKKIFDENYRKYMELDTDEIVNIILQNADPQQMIAEDSQFSRMTILPTIGCPHWRSGNGFSGCSFCDNFTDNINGIALISALKDKDSDRYISVISVLLERSRARKQSVSVMENITAYDSLSNLSIPFDKLLQIYQSANFQENLIYLGLETRAESVDAKKIGQLRDKVCKRIMVECGMEVGDEWIRNHWLNKNTTDYQLANAINIIKKERCIAAVDILLGVPGITDLQNKELFVSTFEKAISMNADYIIVSPLMRSNNNLQNYLYRYLRNDPQLVLDCIVNAEQTGIVDLLVIYDAFIELFQKHPEYVKRMIPSPVRFQTYFKIMEKLYLNSEHQTAVYTLLDGLKKFNREKKINLLLSLRASVSSSLFCKLYDERLSTLKGIDKVIDTIELLMDKLISRFYPDSYGILKDEFREELDYF